jgi:DNA-binding transcriptional ArsR family regulator
MTDEALALSLAALGHGIRLSLYRQLVAAGPSGVGPVSLASVVGLQRNLVSYHLQPLVLAGLVKSERRGRDVNYSIDPAGLNRLAVAVLDLSQPTRRTSVEEV